jgi:hypothetical protein
MASIVALVEELWFLVFLFALERSLPPLPPASIIKRSAALVESRSCQFLSESRYLASLLSKLSVQAARQANHNAPCFILLHKLENLIYDSILVFTGEHG